MTNVPIFRNQSCMVTALPQNDGFVVRIDGPTITSTPQRRAPQPVGLIRKVDSSSLCRRSQ